MNTRKTNLKKINSLTSFSNSIKFEGKVYLFQKQNNYLRNTETERTNIRFIFNEKKLKCKMHKNIQISIFNTIKKQNQPLPSKKNKMHK